MERIIERTEDGSATLFVPELNEHYHSVKGARTESQHIFIDMGLKASAAIRPRVLEIGFGTGLNALLTLESAGQEKRAVHYTGIELYPLSWEEVDVLNYSDHPLFKELHTAPWDTDVNITPYFTLHKIQGDVNRVISGEGLGISVERLGISVERLGISDKSPINHSSLIANPLSLTPNPYFDLVYFDAFAPEKQPEMWSEELFRNIYACMNANGILTTYCAKGVIRRLLQAVGFTVERLPGPPGGKREILRATKTKE
ncbi:tRNA (5-methylaminomethyl-2-thiouridine)(34)-methyltransferase MnmD [Bacteroides clarus]|uniref:tRNA (5-methylaminomethyl-2-thiouridine)(34)-methyltransferase MnmD n=1 Tax=Bacteroides clarus TaxID=626929 RepID=UPI002A7FB782|nr:tRNA (5-methylaminomethyl-2-thiouridine)(34)-methyltransferase MnmD [Bacteroides clarus]